MLITLQVVCLYALFATVYAWVDHKRGVCTVKQPHAVLSMSSRSTQFAYLNEKKQDLYLASILRRSVDSCKRCIKDGVKYIEVAFPENRKSDISVTESLDTNRAYSKEFAKAFSEFGKDLWILFPDKKESNLAIQRWGSTNAFTVTSIETAKATINAKERNPKVIIALNPGFNVDEWIDLAKIETDAVVIVINGSLERLRNGYYPRIFYPELGRVTDRFYKQFTQALFLSPVAVGGDRMGSWLVKEYPNPWKILVKASGGYEEVASFDKEPEPKSAWALAKKSYNERWGGMF